ncbi:FCS-Like Zinc finger 10-like [Humulus lupulus]|uniref:FCS-Like Zinc finger 10-like n=1 Tax=Humulus lupulus TaxID=3486 RepID=UPI002B416433|nr:FCS-Like Zinc finger 10-like [Humulus lupulus]
MAPVRAKRSRIEQSPSYGGADPMSKKRGPSVTEPSVDGIDSHLAPSNISADDNTSKQSVAVTSDSSSLSRPAPIMMISPLEALSEDGGPRVNGDYFLDKCFYCKKKMDVSDHVFMYRNFRAFCTPFCREKVMNNDEEFKKEFKHFCETVLQDKKKMNWWGPI